MNKEMILLWMPNYLGFHIAAWRQEKDLRYSDVDFDLVRRQIQVAERGKFHGAFFADGVAVGSHGITDHNIEALSRIAIGTSRWEPLTVLSALALCTKHIGLLGTISTTYSQPYNVARMLASLDHISGGRAGWNVVTSINPRSGLNFGREHVGHAERYERGEEFFDVVAGLWDSWEDDAFVRDKASGRYFDPEKLHALNHRGKHFSVAGPLNIARPLQGRPVITQAGSSTAGRAFAARIADVVYTMHPEVKSAKDFYDDVKGQAVSFGRDPDYIKILPSMIFSVGHSMAHAEDKLVALDRLVDPVLGMELLNAMVKADLSGCPLDGPVPEVPAHHDSQTAQNYVLDIAKRDNLTIRQLMHVVARLSAVPGTAASIADMFEEWMEAGAADGFSVQFTSIEDSLPIFVDEVIPELQRRGLFHTEYRGKSLRENLGIPRPPNRFVTPGKTASPPTRPSGKSALVS